MTKTQAICVLLLTLSLSGCGWINRSAGYLTGFSLVCVQGVTYVQFPTGAAPLYTIENKLVPCK